MEQKWSMRAYKEGDEEAIFELWEVVRPLMQRSGEQWMRWWNWMYRDNSAGSPIIWFAQSNDKLVGQYAIIPVKMKIGNETVAASQSVDTMTHPDYRRQGVFEVLANKTYEQAAEEGIHVVYGFPNKYSYPGFVKKLGWFDVGTTQTLFKPLNWGNALKIQISNKFLLKLLSIGGGLGQKVFYRARKAPIIEGLTITQVSAFDERINEFWTRVSSQYQIIVVRNKDYLNWRYVAVPGVDYLIFIAEKAGEIYGYLVWRCIPTEHTKVGTIFDVLAQSEEVAQCLISKAMERCEQEKIDLIYSAGIANKAYLKAFKRMGFISVPFVKGGQFIAYSSASTISKEFLKDPQNWFIQIGDSDAI